MAFILRESNYNRTNYCKTTERGINPLLMTQFEELQGVSKGQETAYPQSNNGLM